MSAITALQGMLLAGIVGAVVAIAVVLWLAAFMRERAERAFMKHQDELLSAAPPPPLALCPQCGARHDAATTPRVCARLGCGRAFVPAEAEQTFCAEHEVPRP